jgi:transposase
VFIFDTTTGTLVGNCYHLSTTNTCVASTVFYTGPAHTYTAYVAAYSSNTTAGPKALSEVPRTPRTHDPIGSDPYGGLVMSEKRRKFSLEFRDEAVQEVLSSGRSVAEIARNLGINEGTLGNWAKLHRDKNPQTEVPLTVSERARLRELEKEVQQLRSEAIFLGKAAAFFATKSR